MTMPTSDGKIPHLPIPRPMPPLLSGLITVSETVRETVPPEPKKEKLKKRQTVRKAVVGRWSLTNMLKGKISTAVKRLERMRDELKAKGYTKIRIEEHDIGDEEMACFAHEVWADVPEEG